MKTFHRQLSIGALALGGLLLAACATAGANKQYEVERARVEANLKNFDDLDFRVFTRQQWVDLHRSHSRNVVVHWPDGRMTKGYDAHLKDLKAMFVWAPDTRITAHPIKVGMGDWTAVIGSMEGTFTKPMPIGDGKFIQPTGKAFRIRMATFAHWTKEGPMDEEYLFWDNKEFYRQIGLGK